MRNFLFCLTVFSAFVATSSSLPALESWEIHHQTPHAGDLRAVAAGDSGFIAVNLAGEIFRSDAGIDWMPVHADSGGALADVAWHDGVWLAVGEGRILRSSDDGASWQTVFADSAVDFRGVARAPWGWVAVGERAGVALPGVVFESADGVDWQAAAELPSALEDVAFSPDGTGLGVGNAGVWRSIGGGNWEAVPGNESFQAVAWSEGLFWAVSGGTIQSSEAGTVWSERFASSELVRVYAFRDIVAVPGMIAAVGAGSTSVSVAPYGVVSTDGGQNWKVAQPRSSTRAGAPYAPEFWGVAASEEGAVVVGDAGWVWHVNRAAEWTAAAGDQAPMTGVAYGNGVYVAVGGFEHPFARERAWPLVGYVESQAGGSRRVLVSEDLASWREAGIAPGPALYDVVFADGRFAAVGAGLPILTSVNGEEWVARATPTTRNLLRVIHADGRFVAVGSRSILSSTDGIEWIASTVFSQDFLIMDIAWGDGKWVAVGRGEFLLSTPLILTSTDLETWVQNQEPRPGDFQRILTDVVYGGEGFYATGFSWTPSKMRALAMYSEEGWSWEMREEADSEVHRGLAVFQGSGYTSGYLFSRDGAAPEEERLWRFRSLGERESAADGTTPAGILRLREVKGRLFALGDGMLIASAPPSNFPYFEKHPRGQIATEGSYVAFDFEARDPLGEGYQIAWLRDGEPLEDDDRISGSKSPVLRISNVLLEDSGNYAVRISNRAGEATSVAAILHVRRPIHVSHDYQESTPGWGTDRFASIQAAIDSVAPGEYATVTAAPGVYRENIVFNGRSVLLTSENPDDWDVVVATVIDGGGEDSVVRFEHGEGEHAILRGLTIRNGRARQGGGVFVDGAFPRIEGNWIVSNLVEPDENYSGFGGGIYFRDDWQTMGKRFNVSKNRIENNVAQRSVELNSAGCGIAVFVQSRNEVVIEENEISGNNGGGGGGLLIQQVGGLMANPDPHVTVWKNTITDNSASSLGGGVMIRPLGLRLVVEGNQISFNQSEFGGGIASQAAMLHLSERRPEDLIIRGNRISENAAVTGGGLHLRGGIGRFLLEGNILSGNDATNYGGAASLELRVSPGLDEHVIAHNTIVGNSAPEASAIASRWPVEIRNSILAFNAPTSLVDPPVTLVYSNIWGNTHAEHGVAEPLADRNGTISADPLFADAENGDFRLRSQAGRWDANANGGEGAWVIDSEQSPAIAAGAPGPDGHRPNLGAFGLSDTASRPLDEPLVSLAVLAPGEGDTVTGEPAEIVLSRTGPLESELVAAIDFRGPAAEQGAVELPDPFVFAAGEAVLRVQLMPVPATGIRGDLDLTVELLPDSSFARGLSRMGEVWVLDHPYRGWLARNLPPEQWNDPELTDPLADLDGNGMTNLTEFAFTVENGRRTNLPQSGIEVMEGENEEAPTEYLTVSFRRTVRHHGVSYTLEGSADLRDWEEIPVGEPVIEPEADGKTERVILRDERPLAEQGAARFLRVRVSQEEP